MAETPTMDELARRYMDLWEEQLSAVAADPALAGQMGQLFQAMAQGAGALFPAGGVPGAAKTNEAGDDGHGQPSRPAPGAAATGVSSERGDDDMAELTRRLAVVEERLTALEAKPRRKSGSAKSATGKKRGG